MHESSHAWRFLPQAITGLNPFFKKTPSLIFSFPEEIVNHPAYTNGYCDLWLPHDYNCTGPPDYIAGSGPHLHKCNFFFFSDIGWLLAYAKSRSQLDLVIFLFIYVFCNLLKHKCEVGNRKPFKRLSHYSILISWEEKH